MVKLISQKNSFYEFLVIYLETAANKIKKRGVVIIRNVISKLGAEETLSNLRSYMIQNGENPDEMGRTFFEVYWSKPQVHPYIEQHNN